MEDDELAEHLTRTSRTFALAIPLLDAPLRRRVGLAYLLFRIADTLEDAELYTRDERISALTAFSSWLEGDATALRHLSPPTRDRGCLALLARADAVLDEAPAEARVHVARTARGMASFAARMTPEGHLELATVRDLRDYCYVVAGIVGEMLTDLFEAPRALEEDARAFGEGLQLVNILKDAPTDAREGRRYLPPGTPRTSIVALARADLRAADRYVEALRVDVAVGGTTAFCTLARRLAEATLDRLDVGEPKLLRDEVLTIFREVTGS